MSKNELVEDKVLFDATPEELKSLKARVEKALATVEDRRKQAAHAQLEALAKELGFGSAAEIMEGVPTKGKKTKNAPKYRNPDNPEEVWTGRGRKPNWFQEKLDAGVDESELLIAA